MTPLLLVWLFIISVHVVADDITWFWVANQCYGVARQTRQGSDDLCEKWSTSTVADITTLDALAGSMKSSEIWVGAKRLNSGEYQWTATNAAVADNLWSSEATKTQVCVAMTKVNVSGDTTYRLQDWSCKDSFSYLCQNTVACGAAPSSSSSVTTKSTSADAAAAVKSTTIQASSNSGTSATSVASILTSKATSVVSSAATTTTSTASSAATGTTTSTTSAATGTTTSTTSAAATGTTKSTTSAASTGTTTSTTSAATGTTTSTTSAASTGTTKSTTSAASTGTTTSTTSAATGTTTSTTSAASTGTTKSTTSAAATGATTSTTSAAATGTTKSFTSAATTISTFTSAVPVVSTSATTSTTSGTRDSRENFSTMALTTTGQHVAVTSGKTSEGLSITQTTLSVLPLTSSTSLTSSSDVDAQETSSKAPSAGRTVQTSNRCACSCKTANNSQTAEVKANLIIQELLLQKSALSKQVRKYNSAQDWRPSAIVTGGVGVVCLVVVVALVLTPDAGPVVLLLYRHIKRQCTVH